MNKQIINQRLADIKMVFCTLLAASLLSNCQSTKAISAEDRATIRKVYVHTHVKMPEKPYVQTRGDVWAMTLGGVAGGAIGGAAIGALSGSNMSKEDLTLQVLQTNKIRLDQMIRNDFAQHLKQSGMFTVVDSPKNSDAQFDLEVQMYGIGQNGNAFSNKYRTNMNIKGSLSKKSGDIVWKNYAMSTALDANRPQTTLNDLLKNPSVLRQHMEKLSQVTSYNLVQKISPTKP